MMISAPFAAWSAKVFDANRQTKPLRAQGTNEIHSGCDVNVSLDRDIFLENPILDLAGALEVLDVNESSCFISVFGQTLGDQIDRDYKQALAISNLTREQIGQVLVDPNRCINR
jgi:hypothetical protein